MMLTHRGLNSKRPPRDRELRAGQLQGTVLRLAGARRLAIRRHTKLPDGRRKAAAQRREHRKASARAKVERSFRVIKRQFGLMKVRFRGLAKNTAHVVTLVALSNLWMARRQLEPIRLTLYWAVPNAVFIMCVDGAV